MEPLQHRFAYIGADLQDLYGVDPATIAEVTALQDSYFTGGTAAALMETLATTAGLDPGVRGNRQRLPAGDRRPAEPATGRRPQHQQITVPFRFVGVVNEFPTAPRDSFFVANAAYITHRPATTRSARS